MDPAQIPSAGFWQAATVVVALVGAMLGVAGVLLGTHLSNQNASRQQERQLTHDALQRDRERQMQLRREVYLPASDALSTAVAALGGLADLSAQEKDIASKFESAAAALQRVLVVAAGETLSRVAAVQRGLGQVFTELMASRMPLKFRNTDAELAEAARDGYYRDAMAAIQYLNNLVAEGETDKARFAAVTRQRDFARQQQEIHAAESQRARNVLMTEHLKFLIKLAESYKRIAPLLAPAFVAIRAELEMPDAATALTAELEANQAAMQRSIEEMCESIERALREEGVLD